MAHFATVELRFSINCIKPQNSAIFRQLHDFFTILVQFPCLIAHGKGPDLIQIRQNQLLADANRAGIIPNHFFVGLIDRLPFVG